MRALGFEPRKEEIKKMVSEVDREATGRLSFDAFLGLMSSKGWVQTNTIICHNNNYIDQMQKKTTASLYAVKFI